MSVIHQTPLPLSHGGRPQGLHIRASNLPNGEQGYAGPMLAIQQEEGCHHLNLKCPPRPVLVKAIPLSMAAIGR